jgi:hypothetical protein
LFAILGSFVVEGEVLAGWAYLDCWTFLSGWAGVSLAANRVPEKVHNQTPTIKKLSQRNFIKFPPEAWSGYFLLRLIIQKFRKITMKKRHPVDESQARFSGDILLDRNFPLRTRYRDLPLPKSPMNSPTASLVFSFERAEGVQSSIQP